jgi:hypothetical protein
VISFQIKLNCLETISFDIKHLIQRK